MATASSSCSSNRRTYHLGPGESLHDLPGGCEPFEQECERRVAASASHPYPTVLTPGRQPPNAVLKVGNLRVHPSTAPPYDGPAPTPKLHELVPWPYGRPLNRYVPPGTGIWVTLGLERDPQAQPLTERTEVFRPDEAHPRLLLVVKDEWPVFRLSCGGFLVLTTKRWQSAKPWVDTYRRSPDYAWHVLEHAFPAIAFGLYETPTFRRILNGDAWDHDTYTGRGVLPDTIGHSAELHPPPHYLVERPLRRYEVGVPPYPLVVLEVIRRRHQALEHRFGELVRDTPEEWTTATRERIALEQLFLLEHYEQKLYVRLLRGDVLFEVPLQQLLSFEGVGARLHEDAVYWARTELRGSRRQYPVRTLTGDLEQREQAFEHRRAELQAAGLHEPLPASFSVRGGPNSPPDFLYRPHHVLRQAPRSWLPTPGLALDYESGALVARVLWQCSGQGKYRRTTTPLEQ